MRLKKILSLALVLLIFSTAFIFGCGETETCTVTFKQEGETDIVKIVEKGGSLDEIPSPKQVEGYEVVWSETDFEKITEDMTVTAVLNPKYCQIIFRQDGYDDVIKTVLWGEDLSDVPSPKDEEGYAISWRVNDFRRIKEDLVVTTVKIGNKYTITFDADGGTMAVTEMEVEYGTKITLPVPIKEGYALKKWEITDGGGTLKNGVYKILKSISVKAIWEEATWTPGWV